MTGIIYQPRTIHNIRNTDRYLLGQPENKFVVVEGIVAAFKVQETPYEENSSMSKEQWENIHGSGLVVGFLYCGTVYNYSGFLHFSSRTPKNDHTGETSDLAMILEASKTTSQHVRMEGEIQVYDPPRMWLHRVYLTDGFSYTTQQGHKANREQ